MNYRLLKGLCAIPGTAGDEGAVSDFVVEYLADNAPRFAATPEVFSGPGFQDMVIAVFGKPRTAVFAHLDTVGYTVAHEKTLFKVGNPKAETGAQLVGEDEEGPISCRLVVNPKKKGGQETLSYDFDRQIAPGTVLTYAPDWKETRDYVNGAYLNNRLGVWNALQMAETMENGALVFSTYEEHGGGGAQFAGGFLQQRYGVHQALISDVTLVTKHIKHRKGVAISMRDRGIPRRSYVNRIIELAKEAGINFQLEVENAGGSDGNSLQSSSLLWDWCFVGPPEANYHRPGEKVHKRDIEAMRALYDLLIRKL